MHPVRRLPLAAVVSLLLAACDGSDGAPVPPRGASPRLAATDVPSGPVGPEDLLRALFDARRSGDAALLARCDQRCARKANPDARDEMRAWRDYGMPAVAGLWRRLERAWGEGRYDVEVEAGGARVIFDLGGALGSFTLALARVDRGWYVRSNP